MTEPNETRVKPTLAQVATRAAELAQQRLDLIERIEALETRLYDVDQAIAQNERLRIYLEVDREYADANEGGSDA